MSLDEQAAQPLPGWPHRPRRLATAVVEDLVERVVGGEMPPGSALPIEPALCQMFGVSRTVIREAVKSLEGMRLVKVRQGQGTTVRDTGDWDLLDPVVLAASIRHDAELATLEDLVDVRRALEAQMAGQAAERADAEHLCRIGTALRHVTDETSDASRFHRADLEFHDVIMAASGNRLARAVIRTVNEEALRSPRYVGEPTPADLEQSNREHRAIYERLIARDAAGAAQAMNAHIKESWQKRRRPR